MDCVSRFRIGAYGRVVQRLWYGYCGIVRNQTCTFVGRYTCGKHDSAPRCFRMPDQSTTVLYACIDAQYAHTLRKYQTRTEPQHVPGSHCVITSMASDSRLVRLIHLHRETLSTPTLIVSIFLRSTNIGSMNTCLNHNDRTEIWPFAYIYIRNTRLCSIGRLTNPQPLKIWSEDRLEDAHTE
jgi:hypothetical protein